MINIKHMMSSVVEPVWIGWSAREGDGYPEIFESGGRLVGILFGSSRDRGSPLQRSIRLPIRNCGQWNGRNRVRIEWGSICFHRAEEFVDRVCITTTLHAVAGECNETFWMNSRYYYCTCSKIVRHYDFILYSHNRFCRDRNNYTRTARNVCSIFVKQVILLNIVIKKFTV